MIKYLTSLAVILFLCVMKVSGQNKDNPVRTFKFGKVDVSEFDTKVKGADSAAAAIKLFDVGKGTFDISSTSHEFVYNFTRHVRFKVVNKSAQDLANFKISLYNSAVGSGKEDLTSVRAATYNLLNGKIEVSKMMGDAKFSSRLDKNHVEKKFTLPNVKEGSIIEYSYTTVSDFFFALDDWYFQGSYPTKYSAFTIIIPEYYMYKPFINGYLEIQQTRAEIISQMYALSSAEQTAVQVTKTSYYVEDVPAIKDESFITTIDDYVAKIGFEMMATKFPGSGYKDFSSTWPKLMFELMNEDRFGRFINRTNYDKGLVLGIIKDEKDSIAKMNLIFNYVKKALKWDGRHNIYTSENSPRAVLEKKAGNSADINLSLLGLLKAAGLICSPVLLSTRNNGFHPGYPMLSKFNNVVVEVQVGGKNYLLDATDEDNLEGLISYQDLSHQGLRVNVSEKTAEWISLENNNLSSTSIGYSLVLGTDNKFTGNMYFSSDYYEGLLRRKKYKASATEVEFLKNYKANKPGLDIVSYKIENLNQPDQLLAETMGVTIEDNVEDAGNLVYFTPMLYERTKDNPFNLEDRKFPVDFAYPFQEIFKSVIEFPEKYVLDKLPKSEAFALPNNDGAFAIYYIVEGNKIAVRSKISINKPVFSSEEYYILREFYKNIVRKQAEQIVFKKYESSSGIIGCSAFYRDNS
jgi:transglutaminase-like putative cysteine protease